ncbi:hypothetical protein [Cellulomonas sp. NS3]|uniref:hypothetical protein n=1 Tax=Cellulomonas sp. NS3 TaxID=2973977 RepID=UPI002163117A|nr:hypothetical protein [Cellulomonas sp. NS3]
MDTTTPPTTSARPIRWRVVLGLAATVLLWPLLGIAGQDGPVFALTVFALTAGVWVGVLGLRDVPRPVATATLAGVLYGAAIVTLSVVVGGRGAGVTGPVIVLGALWELVWVAMLGAGVGLLGQAIQRGRRRRP